MQIDHKDVAAPPSAGSAGRFRGSPAVASHAEPVAECAVVADEQQKVLTFLVGKFEKDTFPFGILEALAVPFKEPMRTALTTDSDQQRLLIVDGFAELLRARAEQAAGGSLEKQKRRA